MRISDWSSGVCSSDLGERCHVDRLITDAQLVAGAAGGRTGEGRVDGCGTAVAAQVAAQRHGVQTWFDQRAGVTSQGGAGGEGPDALVLRVAVSGEATGRVGAVARVLRVLGEKAHRELVAAVTGVAQDCGKRRRPRA